MIVKWVPDMKKAIMILVTIVLMFVAIPNVDAARMVCTKSYFSKLKSRAFQVSANYDLVIPEDGDYYFKVTLTNIQPGVLVSVAGQEIKYIEGEEVYAVDRVFAGGKTYELLIYGDRGYPCTGELLYTKKINIPKYNRYSERPECIEYEEFPLCNKWYQKEIKSGEDFLTALDAYKKSLENNEPVDLNKDKRSIFEKIADFYKDHIIITGPITAVLIAGAAYYGFDKLRKKRKRVKISDDEFKL